MTKDAKKRLAEFEEELSADAKKEIHYKRADELLTLTFCTTYDIDWYPLLTRLIGNW